LFPALTNYKVLSFNPTPGMNFYFAKPVNTVADMKGLRLRASDPNMLNLIGKIGAVPTPIASPDVYMSLQKGVVDGAYTAYEQVLQAKWYEVTKYTLWNPLSQGCMFVIMKKSVWDSMPPEVQMGVNKAITENKYAYLARVQDPDRTATQDLQKNGVNVSYLSASDMAILKNAAASISSEWIAAHGQAAQNMMNELDKIVGRYQ
jgi:TRAP-type C4-dicarboxylate transport system substrate-binding protein